MDVDVQRVLVAVAIIAVALVVAEVRRRRRPDAPTQPERWDLPAQLDRDDFDHPEKPWLLVAFTSSTCASCEEAMDKARVLESAEVAVVEVPWQARKDLHDRYAVEVVPALLVADRDGVVRVSFVGTPTATDLWAALAEARVPGSSPEPHLGRGELDPGDAP